MEKLLFCLTTVTFLLVTIEKSTAQLAPLGSGCNINLFCADPNAECFAGYCRCRANFVQMGSVCSAVRRAQLNDPCSRDTECGVPWSFCKNHKCQCRPKYVKDQNTCKPWRYYCPYGAWNDPLKINGKAIFCETYSQANLNGAKDEVTGEDIITDVDVPIRISKRQLPPIIVNGVSTCARARLDNCPSMSYCNPVYPPDSQTNNGMQSGICCSRPNAICPSGEPLANVADDCSSCPLDTHFCFCDQLTNVAACCPRPCQVGDVFNGRDCRPGITVNGMCQSDDMCSGGAKCIMAATTPPQKMCMCPGGTTNLNGICQTTMCRVGQPLQSASGDTQRCSPIQPCGNGYQCNLQNQVCCLPATNYCPVGQTFVGYTCTAATPMCPVSSKCVSPQNACCA